MTDSGFLIAGAFWVVFLAWAVLDRSAVEMLPRRIYHALVILVSAAFLVGFAGASAAALGGLLVALCFVYGASVRFAASRGGGFAPLLGVVGVVWSLGKIGSSLDIGSLSWLFVLGGSFMLVKIWTFLKDLHDGRLKDPEPLLFLAYCFFFPCFVSGPMHYYGEFRTALHERMPFDGRAAVDHGFRILHGLIKVVVLSAILRPFSLEVLEDLGFSQIDGLELAGRAVVYSLVLYLDFSGYTDIVIGAGGILGVRVPENFRLPYLASNIREFWQRWHITFTRVLTQYLFVPLTRSLQGRIRDLSPRATASLGYLITFLFCGFWHGSTLNFLAWGAFHGGGLSVYDAYRSRLMRLARERRQPLRPATGLTRIVAVCATFLFVSVSWLLFVLPLDFWMR